MRAPVIWSAPTERSGDGALDGGKIMPQCQATALRAQPKRCRGATRIRGMWRSSRGVRPPKAPPACITFSRPPRPRRPSPTSSPSTATSAGGTPLADRQGDIEGNRLSISVPSTLHIESRSRTWPRRFPSAYCPESRAWAPGNSRRRASSLRASPSRRQPHPCASRMPADRPC